MKDEAKKKVLLSLKKARGTIEKLIELVESDAYCIDVAQQVNAAMGLLRSANAKVLESHLQTCGYQKMSAKSQKTRDEFIAELMKAFDVSSRK